MTCIREEKVRELIKHWARQKTFAACSRSMGRTEVASQNDAAADEIQRLINETAGTPEERALEEARREIANSLSYSLRHIVEADGDKKRDQAVGRVHELLTQLHGVRFPESAQQ